jgi:hypothetical protein
MSTKTGQAQAYLFGAVCPARRIGAALVLPEVNAEAMSLHLAEISRCVAPGAHAVVVVDGASPSYSPRARHWDGGCGVSR